MHAKGDSIVEKKYRVIVQLGMTPRYLDLHCHEAQYEVDVGVNEVCDLLDGHVAREEGVGVRGMQMDTTCVSSQGSLMHR
jgi:hypothetical protein